MRPLLLSPPRTRSTILYDMCENYVLKETNLLPSKGHSEPFLQIAHNRLLQGNPMEVQPVLGSESLTFNYAWPWTYADNRDSVLGKLKQFKQAKDEGREYYFKATLNVACALDEFFEVFGDRDIILTLRKDYRSLFYSALFAMSVGMFHAREHNKNEYVQKRVDGVTVKTFALDLVDWMVEMVSKMYKIDTPHIVYYEDMDTQEDLEKIVSNILGTAEWSDHRPKKPPLKIMTNYEKTILNFNEVHDVVEEAINKHF